MCQCEFNKIERLQQKESHLLSNMCLHLGGELGMLVRNYLQSLKTRTLN